MEQRFLMRDDGVVYDWRPQFSGQPNFIPYDGDPKATVAEGRAWLEARRNGKVAAPATPAPAPELGAIVTAKEPDPVVPLMVPADQVEATPAATASVDGASEANFDPDKASKDELIAYAKNVFGRGLNPIWGDEAIRRAVKSLMGV